MPNKFGIALDFHYICGMAEKLYYTMGEVAEMMCVSPSLLRFWEKRFEILKPRKNAKGNRLFSPDDVKNLKIIYHLVKERKMTLAGAEKQLKAGRGGVERDMEIAERLGAVRALLVEIRNELDKEGNYELRITNYEEEEKVGRSEGEITDVAVGADVEDVVDVAEVEETKPVFIEQTLF